MEMNDLMNTTLDHLPDVPTFKPFPPGVHRVTINWETDKEVGGKKPVILNFTMIQTQELAEPTKDKAPEKGSKTNINFHTDNDFGLGGFKDVMSALKGHFSPDKAMTNGELVAKSEGMTVDIPSNTRPSKDKTVEYMNLLKLVVPKA